MPDDDDAYLAAVLADGPSGDDPAGNTSGNTPHSADQRERLNGARVPAFLRTQGGERGTRAEEPAERSLYADVAGLLAGGIPDPPAPTILRRSDGRGIFYTGQVNGVFGEPESGKTLVCQCAAAEVLESGGRVAFVDIDHNGMHAIVRRFIGMDVDDCTLGSLDHFRYVEPEDRQHLREVVADLCKWRPDVVIVDSIGELLPLLGLSSNSPDDFTVAHAQVLKPLAMAGACVLVVDHLPKNPDSKTSGPTGTAAKKRAVGGVSIRVKVDEQFTPGKGGKAYLTINKDRHGGLRRWCPPAPAGREQTAAVFTLWAVTDDDDAIRWQVRAPSLDDMPAEDRVTDDDLAALDALDPPPTSVRDVKKRLQWGGVRATDALREWRSRRSPSVPGERGTGQGEVVPLFPDREEQDGNDDDA